MLHIVFFITVFVVLADCAVRYSPAPTNKDHYEKPVITAPPALPQALLGREAPDQDICGYDVMSKTMEVRSIEKLLRRSLGEPITCPNDGYCTTSRKFVGCCGYQDVDDCFIYTACYDGLERSMRSLSSNTLAW